MYDNPYLNHLQYTAYPNMDQAGIVQGYNDIPDNNAASNNYMTNTFPALSQEQVSQYSKPFVPVKVDPNAPTQKEIKDQQMANSITGGVNSIASAVPVYGQIAGLANAASGLGRGLLKKDEYGQVKGKFGQGLDAAFTPVHQQAIDDASAGKWGDAALDVATGGLYKTISKWTS